MKLNNVVNRINGNVDRFTTELEYYVGGEHFESRELSITKRGLIKPNLNILGFKFHFAFQTGDVLFMARNPHLRKAGMVMFDGLCSDASYILRTKDENILSQKYLSVLLQTDHFWDYCESHKVGSVNFAINWTTLANYEFELPSIEEQRVLADKLWAAYELKEAYKKMIAATDEMVKSQFIEMFKGDDQVPLGDICNIEKGATITRNNVLPGDIPVVAGGQEPSCYHNVANREAGAITVSASGAYAGYINLWSCPIFASDCNTVISKDAEKTDQTFVYFGLKAMQKQIYGLQKGGAQPHVYGKDLQKFMFPHPSYAKQIEFSKMAKQADKSKFELRQAIEKIDKVMKSLIN